MKILNIFLYLVFFTNFVFAQDASICGFDYKKVITIQGSQISGGPHTDFPILIDHTDGSNLTTAAGKVTNANGYDIIFADDNGDPLDFELEAYNGTTGQIVAWVKIPSLTNGADVDIHMLYGKAAIVTNQSTSSTWSANYQSVWHLHDDFLDGTANAYNGTNNGSTDLSPAKVGDGQNFVDPNDWIELNTFPNQTGDFTISGWINTTDNTRSGQRVFCDDRFNSLGGYALSLGDPGTGRLRFYIRGMGTTSLDSPSNTIPNNTWVYVTAVADITGNMKYIYINGVLVASTANVGLLGTDAGNASIGGEVAAGESGNRFHGDLDEIRMSAAARSANWIATQYDAQNSPEGTFYTIGSEIYNVYTSANNGDWDQDSRWSGSGIPHVGANVTINHTIDIDAGSDDYIICTCTISNAGGSNADIDMDNGRILTIIEDLTLINTTNSEVDITLDVDGTTLNVLGDLYMTNNSSNSVRDVQIDLDNATLLNVTGNVTMNATSGDVVEIDLSSTATLNIGGNLLIDQDGGDDIVIYTDENSSIVIVGNLTIDQDGGDDVFVTVNDNIDGAASITIGGDFIIDHNGGDDIEIRVDDPGSLLQVNGNLTIDMDETDDDDIIFNLDGGNFNVAGATVFTRRNDFHEISFDMDGGNFTCSSLTTNNFDTDDGDHSIWISVDEASIFTVNGNVNINQTGGNNTQFRANANAGSTAQIDINGNVNIDHDGGSSILLHSLGNNSIFDISGTLTVDHNGGDLVEIQTDGTNSQFNVGGATTVNWNDGLDSEFEIDGNGGAVFLTGAFTATRALSTGPIQLDLDGGDLTFNAGSTFNSGGALFTNGAIDFRIDEGSVLTNTGNMAVLMSGGDDFNISIDVSGGATNSELLCTGNFILTRSDGDDININLDEDNSLMDITGDFIITTSGGEAFDINLDNDATINIDGSMTMAISGGEDGSIDLQNAGAPSLDIGIDFLINMTAGTADYDINLDAGEITVGRDMTFSESSGANLLYLDADGGDLTITRDFYGNLSGAANTGELLMYLDNGTNMTVGDNFTFNLSGGNDIELHLETNVLAGNAQLIVTNNLTFDHNGATGGDDIQLILDDNAFVQVGGDFTMDTDGSSSAGNFYTVLNDNALLDVNGDIYLTSTASNYLEIELNNSSMIEIAGDFIRQAGPNNFGLLDCNDNSTVEYDGSTAQLFAEDAGAGTDEFDYQNVVINNTFGTIPQLTMEGLATVHGDITFTDGIIASTATNLLVIDVGSDAIAESDNSFVDGPVKKIGNDQFDFPIGDDGQLQQLSITAPGSVTDEFTARYYEVDPHPTYDQASKDLSIDHISSCEYWTLDRTAGASDVQVTLNYDANSCGVTDLSSLVVARWDGTTWRDHSGTVGGTLASGTVQTPLVVSSAYIADMPFTLASINVNNPLPIELLSFTAISNNSVVDLFWTTASETNNDYFTVERSENGQAWESIITTQGAGNSVLEINYAEIDYRPYLGLSYYRLKQTDFDGLYSYSKVVAVNSRFANDFMVYPNPVSKESTIHILLPKALIGLDLQVSISNLMGQQLFSKSIEGETKANLISIAALKNLPSGTYLLSVINMDKIYHQKIIVE